jgi:hypothetical protein
MTDRAKLENVARNIGELIGQALSKFEKVGFALLIFDFGEGGNLA